jgi:hypothetical protein
VFLSQYGKSLYSGGERGDKSKLRAVVEAITGRALRDAEAFDYLSLLGHPVCATITHEDGTSRDGRNTTYTRLTAFTRSVTPVSEGMITPVAWSYATGDPFPMLDWLPKHYGREVSEIAAGRVIKGAAPAGPHGAPTRAGTAAGGGTRPASRPAHVPADDSDIPF